MLELFFRQLHLHPISAHSGRPALGNLCCEGIACPALLDMQEARLWFYSRFVPASQINTLSTDLHGHLVHLDEWTCILCIYCALSVHIGNKWGAETVQSADGLEFSMVFSLWRNVLEGCHTSCWKFLPFFFFKFYFFIYSFWYSLPDM